MPEPTATATDHPATRRLRRRPLVWSVTVVCGTALFIWFALACLLLAFAYLKIATPADMNDSLLLLFLGFFLTLAQPLAIGGLLLGLVLILQQQAPRRVVIQGVLGNLLGLVVLTLLTLTRFG